MKKFRNLTMISTGFMVVLLFAAYAQVPEWQFPELSGDYLGQKLPGNTAELFAPNIISTGIYERDLTMTEDGDEIYFGIFSGDLVTILMTKRENGMWSEPAVVPFARDFTFRYFEPAISADGNKIFLCCTRPKPGDDPLPGYGHQNIWTSDRKPDGSWSDIYPMPETVNSGDSEYFPSVTKNGDLYFTRSTKETRRTKIYRSKFVNGNYGEAEPLPEIVNKDENIYNAFIDPDERFLLAIMGNREDSKTPGRPNYYVFFRSKNDTWSGPVNLSENVNFPGTGAIAQSVSPDGKYLFFASTKTDLDTDLEITYQWLKNKSNMPQNGNSDIYWIQADFIHSLKPSE